MSLFWMLQAALIIQLYASAVVVTDIPVLCSDIQSHDGYKFTFNLTAGAEIYILRGEITIASWENGKDPETQPEVVRLDNNLVITRTCRDLVIKFLTLDDVVSEHWWNFTTTEGTSKPVLPTTGNPVTPGSQVNNIQFQNNTAKPDLPTAENKTANHVWIASVGALIGFFVIIGVLSYLSWKKKMSFLWPCNALKQRFSTKAERSMPAETRPLSVIEMQEILPTGNHQNGISLEKVDATHPSGSGENGVAQDSPRGSVHVVRIHPRCDGTNSPDHIMANKEFQPTANGHLNIPDVDIASHHGDMNSVRNMRDDPGGSSGDVRLNIPDSDKKAEAEPLVNRGGQGQDHVSRCSATPEPDVESKPRVKNFGDY